LFSIGSGIWQHAETGSNCSDGAVGAHAALYSIKSGKTNTPLADWARSLLAKKPFKLVAVALANKMARIAWVVMTQNTVYKPAFGGAASRAAS